jgi:hypothetical protein
MPQRIEDSPGLFGSGVGTSTCSEFRCGICQHVINEGCLPGSGDELTDHEGEYERTEVFAGLDICEECMGRVERSVPRAVADLLPWVARILAVRARSDPAPRADAGPDEPRLRVPEPGDAF